MRRGSAGKPRGCRSRALIAGFIGAVLLTPMPALTPAQADDWVAHLAAGGLVFTRTDAIEMRFEDLYVSTHQIHARYRFYNRTDKDVTTLVAFPLPEIRAPSEEDNFVIPLPKEATNFLGFRTTVDGKPVAMKVEQRALALGVDRTALLEKLALPIAPRDPALPPLLVKLPPATQKELRELGMVKFEEFPMGASVRHDAQPLWSAHTIYYWKQTLPAKRDVAVEHSYTPSVGGSAQTSVGADYATKETMQDYTKRYCIDPPFLRAARNLIKRKATTANPVVSELRFEFVLVTGANWAGPIGTFRLTVDKGAPSNLVSFCMDGVRKVSPTRFAATVKDFWPQRNLEVLILKP